jgi:hypothetical protein
MQNGRRARNRGIPDLAPVAEQKCRFKGCERYGIPAKGFDFFACEGCLDELGRLIAEKWAKKMRERHVNN